MKKKGFTLVELLAVIAILAILVIVAVPNVMKSLKQAKANSFITEVQTILGQAETQWLSDQIGEGMSTGEATYFSDAFGGTTTDVLNISSASGLSDKKSLNLEGNAKDYYIVMNNMGKATELFVRDGNFCYYISATSIEKTDIKKNNSFHDKTTIGTSGNTDRLLTSDTASTVTPYCGGSVVTD